MIASLMMYARPELADENARYWALIRAAFEARGIATPVALSNDVPEYNVWLAPDLVFSQTCGMPLRTRLGDQVTLIGTPDFGLNGCPAGYYNSAVIVRADDKRVKPLDFRGARFAYNQTCSQSGYGAAYVWAHGHGFWFSDRRANGGHALSALMIANGDADIATVDAQSWRLIQRFDGFAKDLRVLGWTAPTPGLPYIAAKGADGPLMFEAVREAMDALDPQDRTALDLQGLVAIPRATYLAVVTPPDAA